MCCSYRKAFYGTLLLAGLFLISTKKCSDAVNEMALHFLAKMKIMVVKDVERDDVEFVCKVHF